MHVERLAVALSLAAGFQRSHASTPLVSSAGETGVIPSWDLQSSAKAGSDLKSLSKTGIDTSSWHHVKSSKCTLMGCLIEEGVYNESSLFYSTNLQKVDEKQFLVPWTYRNEFSLEPGSGKHFFLQTHGISSRADIFLNGQQVASKSEQAGSYAGRSYEVTKLVDKSNALAIQVHPTSYYYDFALGWVDWNPWPTDNGTGVWRDVEIKQTGPVALGPLRIVTKIGDAYEKLRDPATVTLKARAQNLENTPVTITAAGVITKQTEGHSAPLTWNKTITIPALSTVDVVLEHTVKDPAIWWPKIWGDQPLYRASLTVSTADGKLSDSHTAKFGFRSVTSKINAHGDIEYSVNGVRFPVIGAGYAPNMFLRFDPAKWESELRYVLDLGFNTVRLEGKNEHPELYDVADRLGVFLMPGWECCDKWEAWSYNQDLAVPTPVWSADDYAIANASMLHEAAMMQTHPSVLTYLIGSDYWTDDRATPIYLNALKASDWQTPVVASASKRGYSALTGPSGMKMEGPYDWVPPNYWYDVEPYGSRYGAAFGFGSELGAGVGTPELGSLKKFLTAAEMEELWKAPNKALYHMSRVGSEFTTRKTYNDALWKRLGAPASLDDYLTKAQIMDYEAARAQFEAYGVNWSAERPATGLIYWMLNNAWPSLHWNVWDYYMRPAGSYFGAKKGSAKEHVVYDPKGKEVWLVDRGTGKEGGGGGGERKVEVELLDLAGKVLFTQGYAAKRAPGQSVKVAGLGSAAALGGIKDVVFLRLVLRDQGSGRVVDRNVYWVSKDLDVLDWANSEWYVTPVTKYADFTALNKLATADVGVTAAVSRGQGKHDGEVVVTLENKAKVAAFFVSLNLVDKDGNDVLPLTWDDNYVTLWPGEKLSLTARSVGKGKWEPASVQIGGKNVAKRSVKLG
ncbi:family 2 putative glycoside hydrolase [Cladorrhinum samala]|uniref:Family 2 putative glycoside hydrolase n=1 Tax=Cladorrhinum samala TaxID=585594 RepID=A0AAV9HDT2_9PEZI|nr:family 2 putative glycoside hydrolase [Cladorrhinum samala]